MSMMNSDGFFSIFVYKVEELFHAYQSQIGTVAHTANLH